MSDERYEHEEPKDETEDVESHTSFCRADDCREDGSTSPHRRLETTPRRRQRDWLEANAPARQCRGERGVQSTPASDATHVDLAQQHARMAETRQQDYWRNVVHIQTESIRDVRRRRATPGDDLDALAVEAFADAGDVVSANAGRHRRNHARMRSDRYFGQDARSAGK